MSALDSTSVALRPWKKSDLGLLQRLHSDPEVMLYLGGVESPEKILERNRRYISEGGRNGGMYVITATEDSQDVGTIGFWEKEWKGDKTWETGWMILPGFQGRGIATSATREILLFMKENRSHRYVYAFPATENLASNNICRKNGFTLLGGTDFEYPKGHWMKCNEWRRDLHEV